jgi:hypothetical protein
VTDIIRIKRRNAGGAGAPSSLRAGELAYNDIDGKLYYGKGNNGSGGATSIVAIGGETLVMADAPSDGKSYMRFNAGWLSGGTLSGTLTVNGAQVGINKSASGLSNQLIGYTALVVRWIAELGNADAESGSNAGSNFRIARYDDSGVLIDYPLTINRANGAITVGGSSLIIDKTGGNPTLQFVKHGNYAPTITILQGSSVRWVHYLGIGDETGSNVGSDICINSYDDSGTLLGRGDFGNTLRLTRSTGRLNIGADPQDPFDAVTKRFLQNRAGGPYLVNGKITETHASNAATYAVKTLAGADPSAADPVWCEFPDGSLLAITAALSLTIPSGAVFAGANIPFRLWFVLFNDAGTARIGVRRSTANSGVITGFEPTGVGSATAISTSATAFITYANATVSAKPFRIIGFASYDSGLATGGAYAASPTSITLVDQGTKLPGDAVQSTTFATGTQTTTSGSTPVASAITQTITPTSPCNPIKVEAISDHLMSVGSTAGGSRTQLYRNDTTAIGNQMYAGYIVVGLTNLGGHTILRVLDFPGTTSNTRYRTFFFNDAGHNATIYCPWIYGQIDLTELMG